MSAAGDLMAKLEANKKPLAIVGVAGVAGLALLQRRKAGGDVGVAQAGAAPAGAAASGGSLASPAGQVVYSSAASDTYNALQPQLSTIGTAVAGLLAEKSKTADIIPIASTLYAPSNTGNVVRDAQGSVVEVQADGSLYGLTPKEYNKIINDRGGVGKFEAQQVETTFSNFFNLQKNLATANPKPA